MAGQKRHGKEIVQEKKKKTKAEKAAERAEREAKAADDIAAGRARGFRIHEPSQGSAEET